MEEVEIENLVRRFFRKRFPDDSTVEVHKSLYGEPVGEVWICEAWDGRDYGRDCSNLLFECGSSRKEAVRNAVVRILERYYLSSGKDPEELELLLESEGA